MWLELCVCVCCLANLTFITIMPSVPRNAAFPRSKTGGLYLLYCHNTFTFLTDWQKDKAEIIDDGCLGSSWACNYTWPRIAYVQYVYIHLTSRSGSNIVSVYNICTFSFWHIYIRLYFYLLIWWATPSACITYYV